MGGEEKARMSTSRWRAIGRALVLPFAFIAFCVLLAFAAIIEAIQRVTDEDHQ